jgi:ribosome-binding protein aMBF1 (putative translation factor)
MKLETYMKLHSVTDADLAETIGRCRTAVLRYRSGKITPPLSVIAKIEKATKGKVTFKDFVENCR